jgi:hypothetical protein
MSHWVDISERDEARRTLQSSLIPRLKRTVRKLPITRFATPSLLPP